MRTAAIVLACALGAAQSPQQQQGYSPARYRSGALPPLSSTAVGGGEVILELTVTARGDVSSIRPLRTTPPFTDLVTAAVRGWRFVPAEDLQGTSRKPVEAKVLVAAVFRPPALNAPTLGERPRDVAAASADTAFPLEIVTPPFPPMARDGGVVLVEARLDRDGHVSGTTVVRSAPPFDGPAMTALRQWTFRPARIRGTPAATVVYGIFGFTTPVAGG